MRKALMLVGLLLLGLLPVRAQEPTLLSLNIDTTTLQTGEIYTVQIAVENVSNLWITNVEISYDPTALYVFGTRAGSPVERGPFLGDNQILAPRNRINASTVQYTVSLLAPADPLQGTGVVGTFRIYPLQAGPTQLRFQRAELTGATFQETSEGRVASDPIEIAFTPVLLDLGVQGEDVPEPPEVTATPPPSATPILEEGTADVLASVTPEPTLLNITRVPVTPTPAADAAGSASSPIALVALVVLVITGVVLLAMLVIYLRRYRR